MYKVKPFDFAAHGGFFAYGTTHFEEQKSPGIEYVSPGYGLYLPKDKAEYVRQLYHEHTKQEAQKRIDADGIEAIIKYEIANYECGYTGDIRPLEFLVDDYGITWKQIEKVFIEGSL